ncbi:MAG TPA: hypothetical protein VNW15_01625 [Rhizomicrobium sp.]|jgi:hypothetical protein|nr:hypothetical protein [Rhizomicrobium sp.]
MSQIVFLDADTRCWARRIEESQTSSADKEADVWPEVSSDYALENPAPVNPENAPRRVLFEVALVLAMAGLLAVAAAFMAPLPS